MDPLAEKYYSWSPYAYCMNNPVKYVDPDGRQVRAFSSAVKLRRAYNAYKIARAAEGVGFWGAIGAAFTANQMVEGNRTQEVFEALTKGVDVEEPKPATISTPIEESSDERNNSNTEKKTNPKREAREKAKTERESQPASEDYVKYKAKEKEKAEGKDARRGAHDEKEKGEPDRSKKRIDDDYKIK